MLSRAKHLLSVENERCFVPVVVHFRYSSREVLKESQKATPHKGSDPNPKLSPYYLTRRRTQSVFTRSRTRVAPPDELPAKVVEEARPLRIASHGYELPGAAVYLPSGTTPPLQPA